MKNQKLFLLSVLLLAISGCAYYNTFYNARKAFKAGQNAIQKEGKRAGGAIPGQSNFDKAIEKSQKVIDDYPQSRWVDDALLMMGKCSFYKRQYFPAIRQLNKLKEQFPDSELMPEVELFLAKSFFEQDQNDSTHAAINRLTLLKQESHIESEMQMLLGRMYEKDAEFESAVDHFGKAVEIGVRPGPYRGNIALATVLDTLGKYEEAAEQYAKVVKSEAPFYWQFWARMRYARTLNRQGYFNEAINYYEGLLSNGKNKKEYAKIKLATALALTESGKIDESIMAYNNLVEDHPKTKESVEANYFLGQLYEKWKIDYDRALISYQDAATGSRSTYVDSAKIMQRDIQRLLALRQVIAMADRGETGDLEVGSSEYGVDSTAIALSDSLRIKAVQDSLLQAGGLPEFERPNEENRGNQEAGRYTDPGRNSEDELLDRTEKAGTNKHKIIENPELKSFKTSESDKNLFLLAELYLFRFSAPDSAKSQYRRIVNEHLESSYRVRAIHNLIYIFELENNTEAASQFTQQMMTEYPGSPYLEFKESDENHVQTADRSLQAAEILLFDRKNIDEAYKHYGQLVTDYPDSPEAVSALMAQAWIAETHWDSLALARLHYDSILTRYTQSEQAQFVRIKIDAVEKGLPVPASEPEPAEEEKAAMTQQSDSLTTQSDQRVADKSETQTTVVDEDDAMMAIMNENRRMRGRTPNKKLLEDDLDDVDIPSINPKRSLKDILDKIKKDIPNYKQFGQFVDFNMKINKDGYVIDIKWIGSDKVRRSNRPLLQLISKEKFTCVKNEIDKWTSYRLRLEMLNADNSERE
ncbi:tetratricopeptide repeat protein [bacterium]|nr:tetratricopeptide repeat protein [bacterium]